MATTFALYYPTQASPTASWLPTVCPALGGSGGDYSPGVLAHEMADGVTIAAYRIYPSSQDDTWRFSGLPSSEREALITFMEAVLGDEFEFTEPTIYPTYIGGRFPPDGLRVTWEPASASGGDVKESVTVRIRRT